MNKITKEEFETFREMWKSEWYEHWRLLDIDFEIYMLMKGLTEDQFKKLNNDEL
jgi:lipopolysaccharide biosynthesis glycosyltransferase